jgi:tRNA-binding EMAP/Myf-like protein
MIIVSLTVSSLIVATDKAKIKAAAGFIKKAEKHPDADSLCIEKIGVGEARARTVVSGLVNRIANVIVSSNIDHTKVRENTQCLSLLVSTLTFTQ